MTFASAKICVQIYIYYKSNIEDFAAMKPIYATLFVAGLVLGACAQQEEPTPVYMQPNFDKAGNASCDAGYALLTTDSGSLACAPAT